MTPRSKTATGTVLELCAIGDFYAAVEALGDRWRGPGQMPPRLSETDEAYAGVLLACGVLTIEFSAMGLLGKQEAGKNLLTRSARLFGDKPEAQIAKAWIGIAYLRCGEFREALDYADALLTENPDLDVVLRATRTKAIALTGLGRLHDALEVINSARPLLDAAGPLIRGKFYLQIGVINRGLGRTDKALEAYDAASAYFEEAGSARYEGAVLNNLARIYSESGDYTRAHNSAERAITLFQRVRDKGHEGKAWDEQAQIFLKQNKPGAALRPAKKAVEILSQGDPKSWLAEALITHGTALMLNGIEEAKAQLNKAVSISEQIGSPQQAAQAHHLLWEIVGRAKGASRDIVESIRPIERCVFERTLTKHEGRVSGSASELGLRHGAFSKMLKRYPDLHSKRRKPARRAKSSLPRRSK